ncbi:hypothetical protein C480_04706 [Natrialba aegyptia DSM 13077]|uniref:Uncharacterized protein n=1 Tax=Natrialba aegyptia DSM 13077 TaxID=1227491 RepID=M0BA13_9EURY|nr:hypothetical protein C480_04706 [Natrialba aegyptia DSM 13077]
MISIFFYDLDSLSCIFSDHPINIVHIDHIVESRPLDIIKFPHHNWIAKDSVLNHIHIFKLDIIFFHRFNDILRNFFIYFMIIKHLFESPIIKYVQNILIIDCIQTIWNRNDWLIHWLMALIIIVEVKEACITQKLIFPIMLQSDHHVVFMISDSDCLEIRVNTLMICCTFDIPFVE